MIKKKVNRLRLALKDINLQDSSLIIVESLPDIKGIFLQSPCLD